MFDGDELVGDMPVEALVDDCPLYDLEPEPPGEPIYPDPPARLAAGAGAERDAAGAARLAQRGLEALRVRAVRPDRRLAHGAAAAGGRRRGAEARNDGGSGAIAVSIDGNGRRVACDPYTGAVEAVLECARNLACVGAEPLGLTNCLNFGNPEKPHIAWQLTRAVEGLRDACLALGVPVVGGNVSLYNEGGGGPIYPTPIVGMVGQAARSRVGAAHRVRARPGTRSRWWARSAPALGGLGAREAARAAGRARCPTVDLAEQAAALAALREAVRERRRSPPCTTSPTAAWPWRWPSAASRAASAPGLALRAGRRRRRCSARAPAAP